MINNKTASADGEESVLRVDRAILQSIADADGPGGQGTLSLLLRRHGMAVSAPTIGRRLRELEFTGALRKVGVEGRVITERGRRLLKHWQAEAYFRTTGQALLDTLKRSDKKHLLDLLAARRVVETEAAALAAEHATPAAIARLEHIFRNQVESVKRGTLGVAEDQAFHQEIGRASGNTVLASLVSLLRHHRRYNVIVTSMRAVVGGRLTVDHAAILGGIRRKNPRVARQAMERHLLNLAHDLDRYWAQYTSTKTTVARRGRAARE
ncbi:MAG TPA: FCD domain-containing protein [bacterium]|nr:FCD domain-containing protein [bacterium]